MYKTLESTIRDMYKPKAQLDEHCGHCDGDLQEVEIRKADYMAHKDGKMSIQDLMKKYNASQGAVQGEINLMRDHERNNRKVFDRMEEVEIDEGAMKDMAIDMKDMPSDEFQRKYNMSKADAKRKFGKPDNDVEHQKQEDKDLENVAKKLKGASKTHAKQADIITKHIKDMEEKVLTPAEKKKREEVAQAISRDNPDMPMDKKMAIATATAKKVAEDIQTEPATNQLLVRNFIQKLVKEMQ